MKKKLLPISLLCLLGMIATACNGGGKSSQESNNSASETPSSQVSSDQGGSSSQAGTSSSSAAASSSSSQTPSSSQAPNPTGVTLDKTSASVLLGQTLQLNATVAPANANNKEITWSSDDEDVVTVSKTGLVSAVAVGTAKVTAKIKNTNLKAECEVSVIKEINSITIKNKTLFDGFIEDDIESLSIEVDPADNVSMLVTAGALKVTSSNTEVATVSGLTITALKPGKSTITASLFGKTDSFELTIGEAIPAVPYTIANAFDKGIVEAPFNGNSGNKSAITTTCFELTGKVLAVAANGTTGYNAILDDGTSAVYLQVNNNEDASKNLAVGDYAKVACKFTNYYGLLEGVSRKAETNKNASWIPAKDVEKVAAPETPFTPTLATAEAMTGTQYNSYFDLCKTNGTKNAEGATWTAMKHVTIEGTYNEEYVAADKGKYQISDKYGLAPIGEFKLDEPFEGQKSTLEAFLIGANTGKGKSNAIVTAQTPLAVTSFVIDQPAQTIVHGNTLQLTYTTTPTGSYDRQVSYESLNPEIATVDEDGLVTGIYEGSGTQDATIKVKVGSLEQTVVISVFGETVAATAVDLAATASVYIGKTVKLTATTTPAMVSDIAQWSSDAPAVATVDQKGVVTGVAGGTANITVRYNENVSATCAVTVSAEPGTSIDNPLDVAGAIEVGNPLTHNTETDTVYYVKGIIAQIDYNFSETSTTATFWLAKDASTAKGFEGYKVPLANGLTADNFKIGAEATIKCKIKKYSSTIETGSVAEIVALSYEARPATSVALDQATLTMYVSTLGVSVETLKANILPVYCTEAAVWTSDAPAVATVENGTVTAVGAGSATITVTVGSQSATCDVTVTDIGNDPLPSKATLKYNGTANKTCADYAGDALTSILNLDKNEFTVSYDKGGASSDCALRTDGIRMYATKNSNKGNKITVTGATGLTIKSIKIAFDDGFSSTAKILVGGNAVEGSNGIYTINANAFTIFNDNTGVANTTQVRFQNVEITYVK